MPREPIFAAIDIGTSKVFSIVARLGPEGELKPLGTGTAPTAGVQHGAIDDLPAARESVRESLAECLRYVGRNPVNAFFAVVNGDHLVSANSRQQLNSGGETVTVTEQHLRSLAGAPAAAAPAPTPHTDSRNEQILHAIPMRYRLDGVSGVRNPTGLDTNELQLEAHIVRGQSVPLDHIVRALQGAKMQAEGLVAHPLASGEGVLTADEREMGVVVIDIGAGTVKIAAYREGTPCFSSVIPIGGNQLTRDLAIALRVPYPVAEELKIQHGQVLPEEMQHGADVIIPATQVQPRRVVTRQELCEPLYLRSLQILKLIQQELSKAELEGALPGGVTLTGGGARMPGFGEMAARGLGARVRVGGPLWYAGLPDALRLPEYAAALGLLQWAVKHRNRPEPSRGREREPARGAGDRNWSPTALIRRPFARAGSGARPKDE